MFTELPIVLALVVVAANFVGGYMFAADKRAAIAGRRRVPERALFLLAGLGASPTMLWLSGRIRHKTRKQPFRAILITIFALQILLLAYVLARLAGFA